MWNQALKRQLENARDTAPGYLGCLFEVTVSPSCCGKTINPRGKLGFGAAAPAGGKARPSKSVHCLANQVGPLRSHSRILRVPPSLAGLCTLEGEVGTIFILRS